MRLSRSSSTCFFERNLSVSVENIEFELSGHGVIQWSDFLLNPRRLRGSDFLMRWSQGVWSELRFIQAVNATETYYALPYGPSGTAPDNDVRAYELYFERLEHAGLGQLKRPDLLIFRKEEQPIVDEIVQKLGGLKNYLLFLKTMRIYITCSRKLSSLLSVKTVYGKQAECPTLAHN